MIVPTYLKNIYETTIVPNMGVFLTLISQLFNSFMIIFCKLLITDKDLDTPMHPLQILFVRMMITYLFCILYFVYWEKNPDFPFGPKGIRLLLLLRAFGGFIGVGGQYWSLLYLNVSDTVCITFLAPTITSYLAYLVLGERFTRVEAIGGLAAFCGVVLIAKPHFLLTLFNDSPSDPDMSSNHKLIGSCFAFFSTFGTAIAMCSIRKIGFRTHPLFMVSIYALFTVFSSFIGIIMIPGLTFKIPFTLRQWTLLITIGVTGFFMQFLLTAGMQRERASRAIAMTYTQLVYASIFDFIANGTIPLGWSLVGEIVICCSVFSIVYFKDASLPEYNAVPLSEMVEDIEGLQLQDIQDMGDDNDDHDEFKISDDEVSPPPSDLPLS